MPYILFEWFGFNNIFNLNVLLFTMPLLQNTYTDNTTEHENTINRLSVGVHCAIILLLTLAFYTITVAAKEFHPI